MAYLFKVPEGAAKGVDPGFFKQMEKLKEQVFASLNDSRDTTLSEINHSNRNNNLAIHTNKRRVRIRAEEEEKRKSVAWAIPHGARVICAGLACVDMQLNQATGNGGEDIETFQGEISIGGGRQLLVYVTEKLWMMNTCKLLLPLFLPSPLCVW